MNDVNARASFVVTSGTQPEQVKLETSLQALQKLLNQIHLQVAVKVGKSKQKAKAYFDKSQKENTFNKLNWRSGYAPIICCTRIQFM